MSQRESVTVTTLVPIDPETAFTLFTEEIHLWWKPKVRGLFSRREGVMKFEAGVNGRLIETYPATGEEPFVAGRVLAWEPGRRLAFEWRQANFEPHDVTWVEILFEPENTGTRVTLSHTGWESFPADHPARQKWSGDAFRNLIALRWGDLLTHFRGRSGRFSRDLLVDREIHQ